VPSLLKAQLIEPPVLTCANTPSGGGDCPSSSSPQQARVPSVRRPQAGEPPLALTSIKVPSGAEADPNLFPPQQASAPSLSIVQVVAGPAERSKDLGKRSPQSALTLISGSSSSSVWPPQATTNGNASIHPSFTTGAAYHG
jgi:hypothetical protein